MKKEQMDALLEATNGIRDKYIEEAANTKPARPRRLGITAAAAAVLIILIGSILLLPARDATKEYLPIFAIHAYAQDGQMIQLHKVGETTSLASESSELFPGKQTYIFEISITDPLGNRPNLEGIAFECVKGNTYYQPGQVYEQFCVQWVEEDDFYGYRITGWCEKNDGFDVTIRNPDGIILYQKSLWICFDEEYSVKVFTSYVYEEGLSTEALMAKMFDSGQAYAYHFRFSSSLFGGYATYIRQCGGFKELEQRPDAASLLLQRWLAEMEASEVRFVSVEGSGLIGQLLSQDVYWDQLSKEEIALIESYGMPRWSSSQAPSLPFDEDDSFIFVSPSTP